MLRHDMFKARGVSLVQLLGGLIAGVAALFLLYEYAFSAAWGPGGAGPGAGGVDHVHAHARTTTLCVIVPGGGLTPTGGIPPHVQLRLDKGAELYRAAPRAKIITLSAGTPHKPNPVDKGGFPVYEAAAGAAYLIRKGIPAGDVLEENLSLDTIGNAYFLRTLHMDPAGEWAGLPAAALLRRSTRAHTPPPSPPACRRGRARSSKAGSTPTSVRVACLRGKGRGASVGGGGKPHGGTLTEPGTCVLCAGLVDMVVVTNNWHMARVQAIFDSVFALPFSASGHAVKYHITYEAVAEGVCV